MIELFYAMKFPVGCNKVFSGWNHLVNYIFNLFYPIYCKHTPLQDGINHEQRDEQIIVSLTSFPARFNVLPLAIRALLCQTVKPDRIILWLTEEECQNLKIPDSLAELQRCGLEIKYVSENLKPHNKLYYALKENPDAVVISVDDDNVYSTKLVEKLYNAHLKHPECVCCNMAHEIKLKNGKPDEYDRWNGGSPGKGGTSNYFVALGVGGVLYPSHCFDEEYFNTRLIKSLALSADDLWLKMTELRMGISVYKVDRVSKIPFSINGSQKVALGKENNGMKKNDIIMSKLCDYYNIDWMNL